jgi:hypothetical protein
MVTPEQVAELADTRKKLCRKFNKKNQEKQMLGGGGPRKVMNLPPFSTADSAAVTGSDHIKRAACTRESGSLHPSIHGSLVLSARF